ncbi:hypothetical protein C0991_004539, partial [Blastosporella zonata]
VPTTTDALYQVNLLQALRDGDPYLIHPFLAEIGKDKRKSTSTQVGDIDTGAAALHLAIRCATAPTVSLLLSHRAISPNGVHPPGSGTTPLHLAASSGRLEIVQMLLEQEGIDDSLRDAQGKSVKDVASGKDIVKAIQDSHTFLNASYQSLLHSYLLSPISSPPSPALIALLSTPRTRFIDLSYIDSTAGCTLLHEAARRRDLRLIELAVRAGADVFVRDRSGRLPGEGNKGKGEDERVKVFLKQFANHDSTLLGETDKGKDTEPPALKGYLNKYTNVAKGYNTRWFVLKNGVLSYYRHQSDELIASRGSVSLKSAVLKLPPLSSSRSHLSSTYHTTPSRLSTTTSSILSTSPKPQHLAAPMSSLSASTDRTKIEVHAHGQKWYMKANHPVEAARWASALQRSVEWARREDGDASSASASMSVILRRGPVVGAVDGAGTDRDDGQGRISGESGESFTRSVKSKAGTLLRRRGQPSGIKMENEPIAGVDAGPVTKNDEVERGDGVRYELNLDDEDDGDDEDGGSETGSAGERTGGKHPPHEGEYELQGNSALAQLELTMQLASSLASASRTPSSTSTYSLAPSHSTPSISGAMSSSSSTYITVSSPAPSPTPSTPNPPSNAALLAALQTTHALLTTHLAMSRDRDAYFRAQTAMERKRQAAWAESLATVVREGEGLERELRTRSRRRGSRFFDGVEGVGTVRARKGKGPVSRVKEEELEEVPKEGKKVLQGVSEQQEERMAEDMEFTECLDAAAKEKDPLRRLAFVAAFAMSNYSSTIGRIAKPFNPMLSETFEYVRFDKEFRYYSEQVSHHPPISACWAEAPAWHYYGEVDAQNKFMGKSFEIRPTGIAHVELILPAERGGAGYPKAPERFGKDKVVEHYSWKKVTTNVSGFILGSPTIDHYGDMIVTNHRTGDQCILTFKPRGWRGKDAFEIAGEVIDSAGRVAYRLAGRWNSQLIASPASHTAHTLNPDLELDSDSSTFPSSRGTSAAAAPPTHFLLWRNSEKRVGSPFNLTPFAITLNDCPKDTLLPYICPTDCRLRPDQRAFEMGHWELANELKNQQEQKQRSIRKAREEGRMAPHRPRWFSAETDGDTGERVWTPARVDDGTVEYWRERERVFKEGGKQRVKWKDVDNIFIEAPDSIAL